MLIYYWSKKKANLTKFLSKFSNETESDIDDVFKSVSSTIISNIQKPFRQGSGWIIDSVVNHNINISKYNSLACSS